MAAPSALRPRTVGEILDAAFTLYRRRFWPLLAAATVFSLPALVGAILLAGGAGAAFSNMFDRLGEYTHEVERSGGKFDRAVVDSYVRLLESTGSLNVYVYAATLAQAFARAGACLAGAFAVAAALRGEPSPRAWDLVRWSLPRLVAATGIWIAIGLVAALCGICLPIPILFQAILAPACAVLAFERGAGESRVAEWRVAPVRAVVAPFAAAFGAIGRCFGLSMHGMTLVRGSFVMFLVLTFVSLVVAVLAGIAGLVGRSFGAWFVANHYAEVVFLPVVGGACALWYFDLRARREGADLS